MALLYTVSDGESADAADLNQLVNALSNNFGITDTAQLALGRLVLPRSTASQIPGSPITAQTWFVTDEGVGGRLYVRHSADNVAYLPIRQVQKSSGLVSSVTINSTGFVDIGLSVSIVTSGGRLRIMMVPGVVGNVTNGIAVYASSSSDNFASANVRAVVGAQNLDSSGIQHSMQSAFVDQMNIPCSAFVWDYKPAAGAYTVKIQASVSSGSEILFSSGIALIVEEWGD